MKTKLFPTQIEDVEKAAVITDLPNYSEPGTGKTINTIATIERLGLQSGLIICPTIATIMWQEKLEEELGAKVQWLKTRSTKIDKTADFLVASYGVVSGHFSDLYERDNDALVLDESHRLKNPHSQRTEMIYGEACDGEGGLYESSRYCITLTGTPIERYADDLWSQLRALHPEALEKYHALEFHEFQRQFCYMEDREYNGVVKRVSIRSQNEKLLNRMLYQDIKIIRRTAEEVAPYMPPVSFRDVACDVQITSDLKEFAKKYKEEQIADMVLKGDKECAEMRQILGLSKVLGVADYVHDSVNRGQVLVGFWHSAVGDGLVANLQRLGVSVAKIDGSVVPTSRDKIKKRFIAGDVSVIVGQIAAMGEAIDGLQQAATHVVIAEDDWSDAKVSQFYKRLHRNGQKDHVQVDFMRANHPLDKVIADVRAGKRKGSSVVLSKA